MIYDNLAVIKQALEFSADGDVDKKWYSIAAAEYKKANILESIYD